MGQICQNIDSTIVGVLTLCFFQNGPLRGRMDDDYQIEEDTCPLRMKNLNGFLKNCEQQYQNF